MRFLFIALFLLFTFPVAGQEYTPEMTEAWEPKPPVVTAGQGTAPPSDAIILFDGQNLDAWESTRGGDAAWAIEDGAMTVVARKGGIKTRQLFGSMQLHIEWRTPAQVDPDQTGQGRGNSGVFFQERYEVQVLDSFENETYPNGQAGSVYKQHIPMVNASRGPGEWQTYDIVFTAPQFSESGRVIRPAYLTVFHNGVLIQHHVELDGPTRYIGPASYEAHGKAALSLQDHGNPVSYRNIWVRELPD